MCFTVTQYGYEKCLPKILYRSLSPSLVVPLSREAILATIDEVSELIVYSIHCILLLPYLKFEDEKTKVQRLLSMYKNDK